MYILVYVQMLSGCELSSFIEILPSGMLFVGSKPTAYQIGCTIWILPFHFHLSFVPGAILTICLCCMTTHIYLYDSMRQDSLAVQITFCR